MSHILKTIVASKRREIGLLPNAPSPRKRVTQDFIKSILDAEKNGKTAIIAEIKPKSPSSGALLDIRDRKNIRRIVEEYEPSAAAISVLCDTPFFGGGYDLLRTVATLSRKPLLAKEFIIDKKQIYQAYSCGADAILLIVAILMPEEIIDFTKCATQLGMAVLIEVHTLVETKELITTCKKMPKIIQKHILIGINNRNLDTLKTDIATTEKLAPIIKKSLPDIRGIISESGIATREDIDRLSRHVQGFLIGTSILKSENPKEILKHLASRPYRPKIKFCGITRKQDIIAAEKHRADYIGLIFVSYSPRHVTLEKAKKLIPYIKYARKVGVFDDTSIAEINHHIRELNLDFVQLHGTPKIAMLKKIKAPVIQAFRGIPSQKTMKAFLKVCPYILIDKEKNTSKNNFKSIAKFPANIRNKIFIAGGLTPKNVKKMTDLIHPYAVDTARGIEEKPGKKDENLMREFTKSINRQSP